MPEYLKIEPPHKVDDWSGCNVLSKRIVRSGLGEMPAGTIFLITSSGITKHLQSIPCKCCGFKFIVTSQAKKEVFLSDFDFIKIVK